MSRTHADLLRGRRDAVVERWFEEVIKTYASEAGRMLKGKDRFTNPVGGNIVEGLREVVDGLAAGAGDAALSKALDRVIRIRSVQDFTAAEAVGFVFKLRGILSSEVPEAAAAFDAEVDRVALLAFNVYTTCREELHRIKNEDVKRRYQFQR